MKTSWIVSSVMGIIAFSAFADDRTWTGAGLDNRWANPQNWAGNTAPTGSGDNAIFPAGTPKSVLVDANASIRTIYFRNPGMTMTVASGVKFDFVNSGALTINATEDAVIDGLGTLTFSVNTGENWADNQVAVGKTLTISTKITGANGFEHNGTGGTIVLTNPDNDFVGCSLITASGALAVPSFTPNTGVPSPLGIANIFKFRYAPSTLRYTGNGGSTALILSMEAGANTEATIEHAGTGTLTLTGPIRGADAANARIVIFDVVNPAAVMDIAGTFVNGTSPTLALTKRGAGTVRVSSACTHTGNTVINQGTVEIAPGGSFTTATQVRMSGGNLLFNGSSSLGTVQTEGGASTIGFTSGTASGTLTISTLNRTAGAIDFTGADLGGATKIFINNQANNSVLGPWATINGGTAVVAYNTTIGVHASALQFQSLDAIGPSVIQNIPAEAARIDTAAGTGGGITLAANPTEVAMLSQDTATPATVTLGGGTLISPLVQIALGGADLTLDGGALLSNSGSGNRLYLANANAAGGAALTVKAAIGNNGGTATILEKNGIGDVVLAGAVTHTGGTWVNSGRLIVSNDTAMSWPATGAIGGSGGTFVKTGDGTLAFPNVGNTYGGTTVVSRGTISILHSQAFGAANSAPTIVKRGGAIDFLGTGNETLQLNTEEIFAEGDGPDGLGALRNTGAYSQYHAIRLLTLMDDLTVYTPRRIDVRNTGGNSYLNLNGHGIIKKGTANLFGLTNVAVTNDQGTAFFDVQEGGFTLEVGTTLSGGANNHMRIRDGAYFDFYNVSTPINWSLRLDNGSRVYTRAGNSETASIWAGPVILGGRATFESGGVFRDNYTGVISGTGPIVKTGNDNGWTYLLGTNNTWAGGAEILGGTLYAIAPGSLPNYGTDVTVNNSGTLALRVAGANPVTQAGFTMTDIDSIVNNGTTFRANTASLGLDTMYGDLNFTDPFPNIGIRKFGANKLTLANVGPNLGLIRVYGGTLDLTGVQTFLSAHQVVTNTVIVGTSTAVADPLATLIVGGNAEITNIDRGSNVANQPVVIIGDTGRGIMRVTDTAKITGRLVVGNAAAGVGAVYQTGGTVHNTGGAGNDGRIGMTGYGYYLLAGGSYTNNGYSQLGRDLAAHGILHQTGGAFNYTGAYSGPFGISRGGTGVVYTASGTFRCNNAIAIGDSSDNSTANGYAELTIAGDANVYINGAFDIARRNTMTAMLNLNGGEANANSVWQDPARTNAQGIATSQAFINWNGGLFRALNNTALLIYSDVASIRPEVTLYGRGAVIDIPDNAKSKTVDTPLRAPQGLGLLSIPVASAGTGYLGSPFVRIAGGGGRGASAFAHVDLANGGTLTRIEITSPGQGYTSTPTVTLVGGGASTAATLGTPVMGFPTPGGLTKLGQGKLTLSATNTYTGTTEVREGTLTLKDPSVLSPRSPIAVTGGILDLGNGTLSNASVTVTAGTISNGRIAAAALNKTGPGVFTLSSPIVNGPSQPPPRPLTPGLFEGMIRSAWERYATPPLDSIQLTYRAANGGLQAPNSSYAGGLWNGNNHTWCYTGYLWNREDHPVTWTFFGRFDDNMMLVIDGKKILRNGNGASDVNFADTDTFPYGTHTLTPGPHVFEVRFGDGTGDVGPGPRFDNTTTPRTSYPAGGASAMSGLLVDKTGATPTVLANNYIDLANYAILQDPGDGSLFTVDLPEEYERDRSGPGLSEYVVQQSWNTTAEGLYISRQLTTRAGNGGIQAANGTYASGLWTNNNHTWVYKGYLWNRTGAPVTWTFFGRFDDNMTLDIDNTRLINTGNSSDTFFTHTLGIGAHPIEIRFGDGVGDVGPGPKDRAVFPATGPMSGLLVDYSGQPGTTAGLSRFQILQDPGDGSLLTTDLNWVSSEPEPEPSDYPIVNVTDGTFRLRKAADAGLLEGAFLGGNAFNTTSPNPALTDPNPTVELTTKAANGACASGGSINGKPWPDNSTYVYTGYLWNRTGTNVTWTFAKNFDDSVLLLIDNREIFRNSGWNCPMIAPVSLDPGSHPIEIRFGQGGGGCGGNVPNATQYPDYAWWLDGQKTFGIDFQGRTGSIASNANNYALLEDDGFGTLLTWTINGASSAEELLGTALVNLGDTALLDLNRETHQIGTVAGTGTVINGTLASGTTLSPAGDNAIGTLTLDNVTLAPGITYRVTVDGAASDCLLTAGTLDLSGMTIVPASATLPTVPTYIIAHADGGFIGTKPAVSGFPSKYKTMKKGNDMVLTSLGGTLLILR